MAKMAGYTTVVEWSDEIKYQQKSCRHRFGNVAKGGHYMLLTRTNYNASAAQVRTQAQTYSHIQEIRNFLSADTFSSVLQVDSSKGERREFL